MVGSLSWRSQKFLQSFLIKNSDFTRIFFKYCRALFLKTKTKSSQKRYKPPKNCFTQQDIENKPIETRGRKTKNERKSKNNNKHFFTFTFSYRKNYILLQNIFGKPQFILLRMYYSFFAWQFIGNAIIKHQRPYRYALVLQTSYFNPKYLAIDQVF